MNTGEIVGTLGVTLLLLAFALQLTGKISARAPLYLWLNIVGAALAGLSSYLINFWPFVILEAVWTISSIAALFNRKPAS